VTGWRTPSSAARRGRRRRGPRCSSRRGRRGTRRTDDDAARSKSFAGCRAATRRLGWHGVGRVCVGCCGRPRGPIKLRRLSISTWIRSPQRSPAMKMRLSGTATARRRTRRIQSCEAGGAAYSNVATLLSVLGQVAGDVNKLNRRRRDGAAGIRAPGRSRRRRVLPLRQRVRVCAPRARAARGGPTGTVTDTC